MGSMDLDRPFNNLQTNWGSGLECVHTFPLGVFFINLEYFFRIWWNFAYEHQIFILMFWDKDDPQLCFLPMVKVIIYKFTQNLLTRNYGIRLTTSLYLRWHILKWSWNFTNEFPLLEYPQLLFRSLPFGIKSVSYLLIWSSFLLISN